MIHGPSPATLLTEDEQLFRQSVRELAEGEVRPLVERMDHEAHFDGDLLKKFFEMGLMGIETPESLGGAGGSFTMAVIAVEELSRVDPSAGVIVDVQNTLVNNAINRWANAEQKSHFLPRLAGNTLGAYALSEAGSGSDAFALACRATGKGDRFVLNGQKLWITNAMEAGIFLVFANANPEAGYRGITCFVVEKGMPGFTVGKKENKLGIRASSTCELLFEDCEVPKENVIGEAGKGYKIAIETLNEGRIGIGAQMIGLSQGALECAIKYSKERTQFGKPIAEFQGLQFQLAEAAVWLEAARVLTYNVSRMKDAGIGFVKEAAMCKYFTSQVAEKVSSLAVEVYGGYGYTKDYPVEKFYRDAKIGKIYEGTSNMQLQTIAKMILQ